MTSKRVQWISLKLNLETTLPSLQRLTYYFFDKIVVTHLQTVLCNVEV